MGLEDVQVRYCYVGLFGDGNVRAERDVDADDAEDEGQREDGEDCAGGDEVMRWSVVRWFGGVGGIGLAVWSLVRVDWNRRFRVRRLES